MRRRSAFLPRHAHAQRGVTLVELMVGLALGLLAVLVITRVLALSAGQSRAINAGGDAQMNGALAMYTLQRDIQQAGYGAVLRPEALGCTVKAQYGSGGTPFSFTLAPVRITDGANGASDTVTILQARTSTPSTSIALTANHAVTDGQYVVESSLGVRAGDLMIAAPTGTSWETDPANWWCTLFSVAADPANPLNTTRIPHAASPWNQSALLPVAPYIGNVQPTQPRSYLLNMGTLVLRSYSLGGSHSLQATELSSSNGTWTTEALFPQIVNLQALYGKDTNGDGVVDTYDAITPTTSSGWQQVLAVRIALVARSTHYEKEEVTANAPQWDIGSTSTLTGLDTTACHGGSRCIALVISHLPDWRHYRYKVYDTLVPLRNMLWNA